METALTDDLYIHNNYVEPWKLEPKQTNTEVACFYLNYKLTNLKLMSILLALN